MVFRFSAFGIYLIILGFWYKASYIPKIMGWLLIIAGLGVIGHIKVFLFPELNTSFSMFTAGELVFML